MFRWTPIPAHEKIKRILQPAAVPIFNRFKAFIRSLRHQKVNKALAWTVVILCIPAFGYFWDVVGDRSNKIEIILPVKLYDEPNPSPTATPIATLQPREKLKVLRIQFGDVHMNVKVQRKNGDVGWMQYSYDSADMNDY